jgi:hypothetical protein
MPRCFVDWRVCSALARASAPRTNDSRLAAHTAQVWDRSGIVQSISETCRIIELPRVLDPRGSLTFIEGSSEIPFSIRRVFWIYDVPGGERRGGHAYSTLSEFIVALSGSFDVLVDDGTNQQTFSLNRSYLGLLVPPMTWRTLENFSTNAVAVALASAAYDENDYIRDHDAFVAMRASRQ